MFDVACAHPATVCLDWKPPISLHIRLPLSLSLVGIYGKCTGLNIVIPYYAIPRKFSPAQTCTSSEDGIPVWHGVAPTSPPAPPSPPPPSPCTALIWITHSVCGNRLTTIPHQGCRIFGCCRATDKLRARRMPCSFLSFAKSHRTVEQNGPPRHRKNPISPNSARHFMSICQFRTRMTSFPSRRKLN